VGVAAVFWGGATGPGTCRKALRQSGKKRSTARFTRGLAPGGTSGEQVHGCSPPDQGPRQNKVYVMLDTSLPMVPRSTRAAAREKERKKKRKRGGPRTSEGLWAFPSGKPDDKIHNGWRHRLGRPPCGFIPHRHGVQKRRTCLTAKGSGRDGSVFRLATSRPWPGTKASTKTTTAARDHRRDEGPERGRGGNGDHLKTRFLGARSPIPTDE